ncbi:amylosucrase [Shewanella dokdonensis]|uniref:Amylosucrase n=1 Tax=Shewanella dokdonensis TaxID=712036 RepID=A0ABX8DCJ5_9GAMM|nr:amylosucrase [Shewanella dokdonensis]MCL1074485.1 amylosucrase [Shewanella dokdonensis]QVK22479.1 amylosucrase [Shewanella dokdonensis]
MYEEVSHTLLNRILDELKPAIEPKDLRFFYSRLGANFYGIYKLFQRLYGNRRDFEQQLGTLVAVMARNYIARSSALKQVDRQREADHNWFLHQRWVGMALYANGFAKNLSDLVGKVDYFAELGVNLVHILPICECPLGKSDGGYAVSNFRKVDSRMGTNAQLQQIIDGLHRQSSLIALDIVVNHTSDQHAWAKQAMAGDARYQNYFYMFDDRTIPDMFEQTMPEIFPETDPGNFSWNEQAQKWVMTVFHNYQWDLNYSNPEVFIEMLDVILYWANQGVDILRLDAVAFLWKKIGSACQNEAEAHKVLQLFKDCCQVVAPGVIFIAEAIVSPSEIIKYFGEDAVVAKECDIAYNATFMALLWETVATKNAKLLNQGLKSLPMKLERATWLNYLRCHDDIGFGFDDRDIASVGYNPALHRKFLVDYFTGDFDHSSARGRPFGKNDKTGDARISGSLASLVGLQAGIETGDEQLIRNSHKHIIMLHSLIMSFGGIPLLYYGDEVATLNDYNYERDTDKSSDSRWLHRPTLDWQKMARRQQAGTLENQIFSDMQRLIRLRQQTDAFADFNNRDLLELGNDAVFGYVRYNYTNPSDKVVVIANLSAEPQRVDLEQLRQAAYVEPTMLEDLWSGGPPSIFSNQLVLSGFRFYWLVLNSYHANAGRR